MSSRNSEPPGDRIGFRVEQDSVMLIRLDDGALVAVRPVVVDVAKSLEGGNVVYYVQGAMQVTIRERGGDAPTGGDEQ